MMLLVLTIIGLLISVTRISTAVLCSQSDDDAFGKDASDFIIKLPTEITKRGNTDANDTVCVESNVNSK